MAATVKAYFTQPGASDPEIRRFTLDQDVCANYEYLSAKLLKVFPYLNGKTLRTFWKDEDGDDIRFSTDEELVDALGSSKGIFKVYVKVDEPVCTAQKSFTPMVHPGVVCDGCEGPITGMRFKCQVCPDYDLCNTCKEKDVHPDHEMKSIEKPMMRGVPFPFAHGVPIACPPGQKVYVRKRGDGPPPPGQKFHLKKASDGPPQWVRDYLAQKRQAWENQNAEGAKKEEAQEDDAHPMEDCPFGAPFGGPYVGMGQPPWMMRKCMRKMWAKQQRAGCEKGADGGSQFQPWMMRKGWRKWWKKGDNSDDEDDVSEKMWMKRCQQQWYQKQQKWAAKKAAGEEKDGETSGPANQPEKEASKPDKFYPFMLKKNLRKWWKNQQAEKVSSSDSDEVGGSDQEKDHLSGLPTDVQPWMLMKCWKKWWKHNMIMPEDAENEQPEGDKNEPADAQYLRSVGESVAAMLDPLGIDVAVHVETKEKKVPVNADKTVPMTTSAGASPLETSADSVDGATPTAPLIQDRASPESEEWTLVGTPVVAAGMPSDAAQTQTNGQTGEAAKLQQAPVDPTLSPKVAKSLAQMKAMGFTDDGGWLTQLLENKGGDIGRVLDIIQPSKPV